MSFKINVTIPPALKAFTDKARATSVIVPSLIRTAVMESANAIALDASETAPQATGALANSILRGVQFFNNGAAAFIGSWLPYAAKWEYTEVAHPVGMTLGGYVRHVITRGPRKGGMSRPMNTNPEATWGFLRKALAREQPVFYGKMLTIAKMFT